MNECKPLVPFSPQRNSVSAACKTLKALFDWSKGLLGGGQQAVMRETEFKPSLLWCHVTSLMWFCS